MAIRTKFPESAKLTALVVMGMSWLAPGASRLVTVVPRVATRAAGPASERLKVSATVPVLITFISKVLPGAPVDGLSSTATPLADSVSVPLVVPISLASSRDVAVTVNGKMPAALPPSA